MPTGVGGHLLGAQGADRNCTQIYDFAIFRPNSLHTGMLGRNIKNSWKYWKQRRLPSAAPLRGAALPGGIVSIFQDAVFAYLGQHPTLSDFGPGSRKLSPQLSNFKHPPQHPNSCNGLHIFYIYTQD